MAGQAPGAALRVARWLLGLGVVLASVGCGGSQLVKLLGDKDNLTYKKSCDGASKQQSDRLISGEYNPARLFVHTWPKATAPADMLIKESRLVGALLGSELNRVLIIARGGLGKTSLAESIYAQLCGTMPVFVINLKDLAAVDTPVGDTVLGTIGRNVGAKGKMELMTDLTEAMNADPFVLFVDGVEETSIKLRPAAMKALDDFDKAHPKATIVLLARPPVLDEDYGFGADTKLEIPPLDCQVTDAFIARQFKNEEDREAFVQLTRRYGLDEKSKFGVQCIYPYMSTYRDIQVMTEFFRTARTGESLVSPSTVYEALFGARLRKEFDDLRWTQADALDMIDRLVRAISDTTGQTNMTFAMPVCEKALDPRWGQAAVDAGVAGDPVERKRHVCEKTYQSAMFVRAEGSGAYQFSDRSTLELFLARWLNGEVARAGQDCAALDKHKDLLANPGVIKFFVGQPFGRRCLAQAVALACTKVDAIELTKTLDIGLPVGKGRGETLQQARAVGTTLQPQMCVKQVLDDLERTVTE